MPRSILKKKDIIILIFGILIGVFGSLIVLYSNGVSKSENTFITNSNYTFGIDVSHYQGEIDWNEVRSSHHPIEFIFIRSTMGIDGKDKQFKNNWQKGKEHGYIRGAYHYFRPNENSEKQFNNFSSTVELTNGDFPPILDIEKPSKYGEEKLREGVLNWLKLAEKHYSVKPVIYTGREFYETYLKGYVDDFPLWIASYSGKHRLKGIDWTFHQFTEKVRVKGIRSTVDGNDFKGELEDLIKMCIVK